VASADTVFVTETRNRATEAVTAFDRATGKVRWTREWSGAISVPFYAASRGSWVRSTPAVASEQGSLGAGSDP